MQRARRSWIVVASIFAVTSVAAALESAGCSLPRSGTEENADAGAPCSNDAQCDDGDACTIDKCSSSGLCTHAIVKSGPSLSPVPGNCLLETCHDGKLWIDAGTTPDGGNLDPPVDAEPCTKNACDGTKPVTTPLPDRTPCARDGANGVCVSGKCTIFCGEGLAPCPSTNPCDPSTCDLGTGTCAFSPINGGDVDGGAQKKGDCQRYVCSQGQPAEVPDVGDPPPPTQCASFSCAGTQITTEPSAPGTQCSESGGRVCDGSGKCVQCVTPTDCPAPANPDCATPICNGSTCAFSNSPPNTPLPASKQKTGDCVTAVCDGKGGVTTQEDDSDFDDGNPCTDDSCNKGVPKHTPSSESTQCSSMGVSGVCNGKGVCVNCNVDGDCGMATACAHPTCTGATCQPNYFDAGTPVAPQVDGDCELHVCDGMGGTTNIPDDMDPPADPCESCANGAVIDLLGAACSLDGGAAGQCNGAGSCCATCATYVAQGVTCGTLPDECGNLLTCDNAKDGTETDVDCGGDAGACPTRCALNQKCLVGADCASGFCVANVCVQCQGAAGCTMPQVCYQNSCCQPSCAAATCAMFQSCGMTQGCADNGIKDGTETDVDCGGLSSPSPTCYRLCGPGKKCSDASDCTSGKCVMSDAGAFSLCL